MQEWTWNVSLFQFTRLNFGEGTVFCDDFAGRGHFVWPAGLCRSLMGALQVNCRLRNYSIHPGESPLAIVLLHLSTFPAKKNWSIFCWNAHAWIMYCRKDPGFSRCRNYKRSGFRVIQMVVMTGSSWVVVFLLNTFQKSFSMCNTYDWSSHGDCWQTIRHEWGMTAWLDSNFKKWDSKNNIYIYIFKS